eukprot:94801-Amphidinium_carterae.1
MSQGYPQNPFFVGCALPMPQRWQHPLLLFHAPGAVRQLFKRCSLFGGWSGPKLRERPENWPRALSNEQRTSA